MATGNKRVNRETGELELEVIQGNSDNKVKTEWERASKLAIRRSTEAAAAVQAVTEKSTVAVEGFKPALPPGLPSNLLKPKTNAFGGTDAMSPDAAGLASTAPARPTPQGLADQARPGLNAGGTGFQKQGGGGRTGGDVHIHNTIHGAGENPEALAGKIQRHVTEAWSYRSHDLEPELT
ncbi:hypothetical protein [Methylobacterium sp. WL120]|uniref:hypothetical protein n=1 Tax=Methylobacterium sp. WL120 TaxID=2603887 RepID=UPI0011CC15B6|nr:hypothetical protein [Methylobacterium sp. WL120]TXM57560.1 hypothetical protein FV229_25575 [Methylobacterium sp. WL120]